MPRTPVTTTYENRWVISTEYSSRTDVYYLMTEFFDFLMTEDDNYIVLENSYDNSTSYTTRPIINTIYS